MIKKHFIAICALMLISITAISQIELKNKVVLDEKKKNQDPLIP